MIWIIYLADIVEPIKVIVILTSLIALICVVVGSLATYDIYIWESKII